MTYQSQREQMVERQIRRRGVRDERLLDALRSVPRHLFVPPDSRALAYEDHPLSIGYGQTISQPYIVAFMSENLKVREGQNVLEVGCGSGYQAAILSYLGANVTSLERIPQLAKMAKGNLQAAGFADVEVLSSDGTVGYEENAPYDRILVTAAGPEVPSTLYAQLKPGGILLLPVGGRWSQELVRIEKAAGPGDRDKREKILSCVFVPLIGSEGWKERT